MKNGILIQDLQYPAFSLKRIKGKYLGVSSFYAEPLLTLQDPECQKLNDEATKKMFSDGYSTFIEFTPNLDILYRYLIKCKEFNLGVRLLYIESDYPDEVCDYDFEDKKFLGYEYCEIPFDSQVITDFDWYEPLHKYYAFSTNMACLILLKMPKNSRRHTMMPSKRDISATAIWIHTFLSFMKLMPKNSYRIIEINCVNGYEGGKKRCETYLES